MPPLPEEATTETNIARTRVGTGNQKGKTGDRLNAIVEQFDEFYGELGVGVDDNYGKEENRLQGMEDSLLRLHAALATEQHRRVESLKAVEVHLDELSDATRKVCMRQLSEVETDIPDRLAAWHGKLEADENALDDERNARQRAIMRERERLCKTLADFESQLEIEKVDRLTRETQKMHKVQSEVAAMQETFQEETARREQMLGHARDENDEIDSARDKPNSLFKDEMVGRMTHAMKNIRTETATRLHADQMFVLSLESYTKSLQSGLRMVNKKIVRAD